MLTKQEIRDLNLRMLYRGEPISSDRVGYGKCDYDYMDTIADFPNEWSDSVCYSALRVLKKYVNTQLSDKREEIEKAYLHYQKLIEVVKVVSVEPNYVQLSWKYNNNIKNVIRNIGHPYVKWVKGAHGEWILNASWEVVPQLVSTFKANSYNTLDLENVLRDNEAGLLTVGVKKEEVKKVIHVTRSDDSDTLFISFDYDKTAVDAVKSVSPKAYNKTLKSWEVFISQAHKVYDELKSLSYDLSELKSWAELSRSWESDDFELIDITKTSTSFAPWKHQIKDVQKLLKNKVCLNGNEMGLGKTFEQVWVGESINLPKLVICPPSLRLNWRKEILSVNPFAQVHIIYSSDEFKTCDGWNIIGYTSLDKFSKELEEKMFQVVMLDEAHFIQAINNSGTPASNRAKVSLRICATSKYVFPITGTPKTKRNKDMYNILRVLRHPLTMKNWAFLEYGKKFCSGYKSSFGWDFNGNSNNSELHELLTPYMVRNLKKDVLPDLKKQRLFIPASVDLKKYNKLIEDYLKNRSKLKKAEQLSELVKAKQFLAVEKADSTIDYTDILVQSGEKVVIVTCYTEVVERVVKRFKEKCVKLVGGMSDSKKQESITKFQDEKSEIKVMVMNIIAGGVGVTLTASHNMVINDFDWVPANILQAEDRICRGGQKSEFSVIHYMYADGAEIDETLVSVLQTRLESINKVVDGGLGEEIDFLEIIENSIK